MCTNRQKDRQTDYNYLLSFTHESMECPVGEYVLSQEIYSVTMFAGAQADGYFEDGGEW